MKVLQIIGVLNRGGAETLLVNILENIDKNNYDFDFLVFEEKHFDYEDKIKELGGRVIRLQGPTEVGMFKFIKNLRKLCMEEKYDVVHAHTLFNCGPSVFAAWLGKVPTRISHSHNTKILDKNISIFKRIYFLIAKVLLNLFSTEKIACGVEAGKFLFFTKDFLVINNGIDVNKFRFDISTKNSLKNRFSIEKDALILGNIGRLNYQKNQHFIFEIFDSLIKVKDNVYLFILGDGDLKLEFQTLIKERGIEERVFMLGNVDNANEFYSLFDLFLFPSFFEGLPLTLVEAQSNGLPIICSNRVSDEVDLTNEIDFLPLENGADYWADYISNYSKKRYDKTEVIIDKGYDIKTTVNNITEIYTRREKRC
ncbi:glycosyltransferase family 1 protein [Streptococcus henryi]